MLARLTTRLRRRRQPIRIRLALEYVGGPLDGVRIPLDKVRIDHLALVAAHVNPNRISALQARIAEVFSSSSAEPEMAEWLCGDAGSYQNGSQRGVVRIVEVAR